MRREESEMRENEMKQTESESVNYRSDSNGQIASQVNGRNKLVHFNQWIQWFQPTSFNAVESTGFVNEIRQRDSSTGFVNGTHQLYSNDFKGPR